jgi:hypothetical protein
VGVPGTSKRNAFIGPGYSNFDVAMHKSFRIREGQAFQIRLEAYNVFNSARFGLPNTDLGCADHITSTYSCSSKFGSINSTVGNPRKMQFALRYQF